MSFLMSESPVEAPVEADEIAQLRENERLGFESRWEQAQNRYREERDPDERNVLLNDPLLEPWIARNIREGAIVGFCRYGDLSNAQIKERFRQPLEHLKCSTPFPMLTLPLPFKDIPCIDQDYNVEMVKQARDTYAVCMEQLKYVMNIGNDLQQHHVKRAEAMKDDPEKQCPYQAQWSKADELHRSLVKINKVIREMHSTVKYVDDIFKSVTHPAYQMILSSE